ncbi:hypothetical protein HHK36_029408 [Tetracentron sinense]|uniref:U5 small nuclear ribonucleoprotein TSSC4 n=1 Tax=Tetracentron sinense TaxID=13715 RepID=A0A835D2K8_TETSI|nr:hypothetical protein HHK36_029408 [Tetracentron sinense]
MEDSFRVRVDRVFGSLSSSQSASMSSLWSLADDEVQKREWNREKESSDLEETPCSSSFDGFFSNEGKVSEKKSRNFAKEFDDDHQDLHQDDEDETLDRGSSSQSFERGDCDKDEWEIRSSIGRDCTLDNEEEEDEYDKVATGMENAGDRLYMKDVTDYRNNLNTDNACPNSFKDVGRDPRANHLAAIMRLKEDEETAGSFDSLRPSDKTMASVVDPQVKSSKDGGNLKSILKRKKMKTDLKSQKRVRFDPGCKDDCDEESEGDQDISMVTHSLGTTADDGSLVPEDASGVPDYIRNPSKYTRYSFDSSSEDEESNRKAYMDFLHLINRSNTIEVQPEGASSDLPKSVTFTPKKKGSDATTVKSSTELKKNQEDACKVSTRMVGFPAGIAAWEARESEVCAMDEDEPETTTTDRSSSSHKPGRQYRSKVRLGDSVS